LSVLQDAQKQIAPVWQELQKARQDLAGVYINGASDKADDVLKAYTPLAAQITGIEAGAFAKVCKMLKANQRKNAPQAFELLADIFERPRPGNARGEGRGERKER